jgi:hypothetical protein
MTSECLQVEMARERVKEGVEGTFIPPPTQNIAVKALRPGVSGVNSETPGRPQISG